MNSSFPAVLGTTSELAGWLFHGVSILFVVGFLFYLIFAVLVIRQIDLMQKTVITNFSLAVRVIGWFHLFLSILALLFALSMIQ